MNVIYDALNHYYAGTQQIECPVRYTWTCDTCQSYIEMAINNSIRCTLLFNHRIRDSRCACVAIGKEWLDQFRRFIDTENAKGAKTVILLVRPNGGHLDLYRGV